MLNFAHIFLVDAEFGPYLCSGCCIPIFLNAYSDFSISVTKIWIRGPLEKVPNHPKHVVSLPFQRIYGSYISAPLGNSLSISYVTNLIE